MCGFESHPRQLIAVLGELCCTPFDDSESVCVSGPIELSSTFLLHTSSCIQRSCRHSTVWSAKWTGRWQVASTYDQDLPYLPRLHQAGSQLQGETEYQCVYMYIYIVLLVTVCCCFLSAAWDYLPNRRVQQSPRSELYHLSVLVHEILRLGDSKGHIQ